MEAVVYRCYVPRVEDVCMKVSKTLCNESAGLRLCVKHFGLFAQSTRHRLRPSAAVLRVASLSYYAGSRAHVCMYVWYVCVICAEPSSAEDPALQIA